MILFCVGFCSIDQEIKLSDIAKTLQVTLPAVTHKVNDLVRKKDVEKKHPIKI
jgi:predicted transcriptional regulator